ncbi:hypothetical protein FM107_11870 [Sphingobacterium sp. JB170]|nr:hypothetical protein FM107_11870 [Sphingobacterium sp. JB170]
MLLFLHKYKLFLTNNSRAPRYWCAGIVTRRDLNFRSCPSRAKKIAYLYKYVA